MKILLTGAAGFIGSHTCERLVSDGHEVVGVDCFDSYLYDAESKRENAAVIGGRLDPKVFTLIEADICDVETMDKLLAEGIEVVCHLAALAGVRPSLREPLRYIRTNLQGTGVLLEGCRKAGIKRFVAASSSSVYGIRAAESESLQQVAAFREDDSCLHPASPYAATKRSAELICSTYRDLFGIGSSSLRYFTVYGPRQRPDMAIHRFTKRMVANQPITMFGDGSSRRDYTYIDDIVSGTVAACEKIEPGAYNIYNVGGTSTISLRELVDVIENVTGIKATVEQRPNQPGDVPVTYADITKASRDLGYRPTTSVEQGVAHFWRWFQERQQT